MSDNGKDTENMDVLRGRIDELDRMIVDLLNKRAGVSLEVGRIKAGGEEPVFRPFREKEVLDRLESMNPGPLPPQHLRAIYREIMSSSRRLQRPDRVVYLGPEGTFTHFAAQMHLGQSSELVPAANIEEIFQAVSVGDAALGVIPLENSQKGTVGQTVDLFMQYPVFVQAEIYSPISHCLLGNAARLKEITEVRSHPKALEQCAAWLKAHLPQARLVPDNSTAAAAQGASENATVAAVGHVGLARRYGLTVLARRLEDLPDNWTRFVVIGSTPSETSGRDKTSILFTTPDRPGALVEVLGSLAGEAVNLTKLESRPYRGEKWKYVFFADLECDLASDEYASLLADLKAKCNTLKVLGSYPAGTQTPSGD